MSELTGSVTRWINMFEAGDRQVVRFFWERYFPRLVGLARNQIRNRAPGGDADEEDIALSAFASFCHAAENNRFPELNDRNDLWQILVMLTLRKVEDRVRYSNRQKRDWRRDQRLAQEEDDSSAGGPLKYSDLIGSEPDPAFAAEMGDQCRALLDGLPDDECRRIALLRMELFTNDEIAEELGYARATIERRLSLIRRTWIDEEGETL